MHWKANPDDAWQNYTTHPGVTVSGSNVTVTNPIGYWRISTTSPTTEDLGTVFFNGTSGSATLLIGGATTTDINVLEQLPDASCRDWQGLSSGGVNVTVQARVNRSITAGVTAHRIAVSPHGQQRSALQPLD